MSSAEEKSCKASTGMLPLFRERNISLTTCVVCLCVGLCRRPSTSVPGGALVAAMRLTIGLVVRMPIWIQKVDGSNPCINMFSP